MKKFIRNFIVLVMIQLILSLLICFIHRFMLVTFINTLFVTGLISIIIGGFMYVNEKGFFKLSNYGFKKIKGFLFKRQQASDENEKQLSFNDYILQPNPVYSLTLPLLSSGLFNWCVSFILAYTLY